MTLPHGMEQQKIALEKLVNAFHDMPFNRQLGLHLDELTQTHVMVSFAMRNELVGNFMHGILHGGVISSVLDTAGGMAAMASLLILKKKVAITELETLLSKTGTIDLHVSYLLPGKGERFIATAEVVHSGNRICFTKMALQNQQGVLIANAAGTYKLGATD